MMSSIDDYGPHFSNVVQLVGMTGGNADIVNGYYIPSAARLFSFPVYNKYCQLTNQVTGIKLCVFHQSRRYYWVIRDNDENIVAKVKYPSQCSLCLPHHIPNSLTWELLSTGFFGGFKKKPNARFELCGDNAIMSHMSSFVGGDHFDSISESIRFIDATIRDVESMMETSMHEPDVSQSSLDDRLVTDIDVEHLSMDEMIALYSPQLFSNEMFNGYGSLISENEESVLCGNQKLDERETSATLSTFEMEKLMIKLADEAPEDFIDPITLMIMRNPMKVSASRYIYDRSTLQRHLAISSSDPYSRQPLTMDMIYPDVFLKTQIDMWLQRRGIA